jgi:hypothetical protein
MSSEAQPSSTPLCQRLHVIMTKWLGLIQIARNPYRPELHYMRGPGPKWYAKHQGTRPRAAGGVAVGITLTEPSGYQTPPAP